MAAGDLLARFEEHLVSLRMAPATVSNYLADIRDFSGWLSNQGAGDVSLLDVSAQFVRRYCHALRIQGRSSSTINRRLQAVRKFYDFAGRAGLVSHNPAREVARVDERSPVPPRVLASGEAHRLLCAVGNGAGGLSRRDRAILLLLLNTGIKVRELVDLRVEDLNLDVGTGYVLVGQDVRSGGRCLTLDSETCAALRAYMRFRAPAWRVDHLFLSRQGSPLSVRSVQRLVTNYADVAGLKGVSAHTLRYTFAHDALEENDPVEVAKMLGLRDVTGVRRYFDQ
jgi:site-specific recombinase XerD